MKLSHLSRDVIHPYKLYIKTFQYYLERKTVYKRISSNHSEKRDGESFTHRPCPIQSCKTPSF